MEDEATGRFRQVTVDAEAALALPFAQPPGGGATGAEHVGPQRHDTPLLGTPLFIPETVRATLTVLTGLQAGQLMALDEAPVTIGRAPDADLVIDDTGVSRRHARITHTLEGVFSVEDLGSTNGTFVSTMRIGVALLEPGDLLQLGPHLRLRFAVVDSTEETLFRQLYESSIHDPLTQAYNRRYLGARLLVEISRARRAQSDLALLMIDVDSLKTINDSFGHLAGDQALRAVAARITRTVRVEDLLARYGGDEFVVLAAGTDVARAEQLAERVRGAVEGLRIIAGGREVGITTSIGVASLGELAPGDEPAVGLLALADARMYTAKGSGKNRVCRDATREPTPAPVR